MSETAPSGDAAAATEAAADTPVAGGEEEFVIRTPRKGWVKSSDGRFHEVDDVEAVLEAYPEQYEEVKERDVVKSKVGWAEDKPKQD